MKKNIFSQKLGPAFPAGRVCKSMKKFFWPKNPFVHKCQQGKVAVFIHTCNFYSNALKSILRTTTDFPGGWFDLCNVYIYCVPKFVSGKLQSFFWAVQSQYHNTVKRSI